VKIIRDADDGWKELEAYGEGDVKYHGYANGKFLTDTQK
jgi:hypothetical protein